MPAIIAILVALLLFNTMGDARDARVRQKVGVKFETGKDPKVDYEVEIKGEKSKVKVKL